MNDYRIFPDRMKGKKYSEMSKADQKLLNSYVKIFKHYKPNKSQLVFITFYDKSFTTVIVPAQSIGAKLARLWANILKFLG